MKILVLGIGNTLLMDEGAGVHVLSALRAGPALPDDVELMTAVRSRSRWLAPFRMRTP